MQSLVRLWNYRLFGLLLCLCVQQQGWAQQFLREAPPLHPTLLALGGTNLTKAGAGALALQNIALADSLLEHRFSVSMARFGPSFTGGQVQFSHAAPLEGTWTHAISLLTVDGGVGADAQGQPLADPRVQSLQLQTGYARGTQVLRYGFALGLRQSTVALIQESAFFFQLGFLYQHPVENVRIALAFEQAGLLYRSTEEELPPGGLTRPLLRFGVGFRPEGLPIGLHASLGDPLGQGSSRPDPLGGLAQVARQRQGLESLVFAAELFIREQLTFQLGYRQAMRSGLQGLDGIGLTGISTGLRAAVGEVTLSYGHLFQAFAPGSFHAISLSTSLQRKKRFDE
ncbi:hypothetical protein A3SI_12629 [Nitritalea halalkaliphila LW7]|uniref:Type IX secretion system protein PorQ n=1 Tax=Nitritalea halalkaliphila LW7 TaxID=1189621 RepID=I5C1J1_9BACT|nr:hypothetical protein [Nitritalea halalkaliphila]EIM75693.1 hypothetical protein A3SI_12629 [Nitritalea halalkaliphila LW7]